MCIKKAHNPHLPVPVGISHPTSELYRPHHEQIKTHRILRVGKDLQGHPAQPLTKYHQTISQNATSAQFLSTSRDGDFTASLGKPVQILNHSFSQEFFPDIQHESPPESISTTKASQHLLLPTTLPSQEPPAIHQDYIPCSTMTGHHLQLSTKAAS